MDGSNGIPDQEKIELKLSSAIEYFLAELRSTAPQDAKYNTDPDYEKVISFLQKNKNISLSDMEEASNDLKKEKPELDEHKLGEIQNWLVESFATAIDGQNEVIRGGGDKQSKVDRYAKRARFIHLAKYGEDELKENQQKRSIFFDRVRDGLITTSNDSDSVKLFKRECAEILGRVPIIEKIDELCSSIRHRSFEPLNIKLIASTIYKFKGMDVENILASEISEEERLKIKQYLTEIYGDTLKELGLDESEFKNHGEIKLTAGVKKLFLKQIDNYSTGNDVGDAFDYVAAIDKIKGRCAGDTVVTNELISGVIDSLAFQEPRTNQLKEYFLGQFDAVVAEHGHEQSAGARINRTGTDGVYSGR